MFQLTKTSRKLTLAIVQGRIHAGRNFDRVHEAIGIIGNRIEIIAENEDVGSACDSRTQIVALNHRVLIPGFIDAHTHFIQMGVNALQLDLSKTKSLRSAMKKVSNRCKAVSPGQWVLGSGWDESRWPENRYPLLMDLDPVSSDNPVWLRRVDGHMGIANKLALGIARIPESTRGFERNEDGRAIGVLREDAMEIMEERVQPDQKVMVKGLKKATAMARRLGVTSIHDMAEPQHIKIFQKLAKQGILGVRVYLNFFPSSLRGIIGANRRTGEGDEFLKLGALKLFADGSLGARTAALWEPYADAPEETGILVHKQGELTELVRKADSHGIQLAIHCIGERGIEAALTALEDGCDERTLTKRRHRLEHFELMESSALRRAGILRTILSMQPNYVDLWSRPGGLYESRLGRKRLRLNNPFSIILKAGLPVAFGSDCMPFSPLYGISSAANAPLETQRLSVKDSIASYTWGSAYASFDEENRGAIEVGKLADLVVLSNNPFEDPRSLSSTKVDMTIFDGRVVFVRHGARDLRSHLYVRRKKNTE